MTHDPEKLGRTSMHVDVYDAEPPKTDVRIGWAGLAGAVLTWLVLALVIAWVW